MGVSLRENFLRECLHKIVYKSFRHRSVLQRLSPVRVPRVLRESLTSECQRQLCSPSAQVRSEGLQSVGCLKRVSTKKRVSFFRRSPFSGVSCRYGFQAHPTRGSHESLCQCVSQECLSQSPAQMAYKSVEQECLPGVLTGVSLEVPHKSVQLGIHSKLWFLSASFFPHSVVSLKETRKGLALLKC